MWAYLKRNFFMMTYKYVFPGQYIYLRQNKSQGATALVERSLFPF